MNRQGRSQLVLGVILILLGAWFFLDRTMPNFHDFFEQYTVFPNNMFLMGAGLFLFGLIVGAPGLSVPACILAGLGGIFLYQQIHHDSSSWSYMWTLILGFIGIGVILQGVLGDHPTDNFKRGLNLVIVSAVLFLVFSYFLGNLQLLGNYGPAVVLILLGLWILGRGMYRTFRRQEE